ncbi:MAG: exodeoxyribonuclease VII large subunit [Silvanigrellales bacterium]|nr:exodeoxyribonuclease VII large subunit [Silvanigrellales bacterium]
MTRFFKRESGFLHLSGDTFPVKDEIKSAGARWDAREKRWVVRDAPETLAFLEAMGFFARTDGVDAVDALAPVGETVEAGRTWSVAEFVEFVEGVFSRQVAFEFWIVGEITSLRISNGHCYFDLAEREDLSSDNAAELTTLLPRVPSKSPRRLGKALSISCVLWAGKRAILEKTRGELPFAEGVAVKIRVHAEFRKEGARINLVVNDCDAAYTLGGLALQRLAIVKELKRRGLYDANKRLRLAPFPLRVALVTAEASRALSDFLDELKGSGLAFRVTLFNCHMQGEHVSRDVAAALQWACAAEQEYDVVVITRGGGSRLDLRWFDDLEVAKAIAHSPLPVITAIGHFEDVSVADEVSFLAEKTPTGAAGHLVECVARSLERCDEGLARAAGLVARRVRAMRDVVEHGRASLSQAARRRLALEKGRLTAGAQTLRIAKAHSARPLSRGYALARNAQGRLLRARDLVDPGMGVGQDIVVTLFDPGTSTEVELHARVLSIDSHALKDTPNDGKEEGRS